MPDESTALDLSEQRTDRGRFAAGNKVGKGNPIYRRMHAYREALARALTPDTIADVVMAMAAAAIDGDVAAARLILSYACGLPEAKIDLDISGHLGVSPDDALRELSRLLAARTTQRGPGDAP